MLPLSPSINSRHLSLKHSDMSVYDKDLLSGLDKVQTAIKRIQQYCAGKKTLVAFSGGKDSQCCYHLAKMAGIDFSAQYSITRFEPPELIRFIRKEYPDVIFRRAYKMSLYKQIEKYGLPNRFYRYCCDAKHKKTEGFDIAVIGVRAQESAKRAANWRMFGQKQDRSYYICPIIDWTENDVWEFLNSNNIPHCKLYDEGYSRIGCVLCPLSMKMHKQDVERYPKIVNLLRNAFYAYYEKKEQEGFKTRTGKVIEYLKNQSKEECFNNWVQGGMHVISDTRSVEDEEPCLFAGTGFSESDGRQDDDNL